MSPRIFLLLLLVSAACVTQTMAKPVRRKLNFNMFVLKPPQEAEDRVILSTNGISRFGPILEYFLQRLQGMFSVRIPQDPPVINDENITQVIRTANTAENEIDGEASMRIPGVVVRPSQTKPGTYEVEISVEIEDGQPQSITTY